MEKALEHRLIELDSLSKAIERISTDSEGEVTVHLENLIQEFIRQVPQKVDEAKLALDRLEVNEKFWRSEADDFLIQARNCKYARERIRTLIRDLIQNKPGLSGNRFEYYLAEGVESVDIVDLSAIPEEFTQRVPLLERIREKLRNGIEVPGARLLKGKSLRSRIIKDRKELHGISESSSKKSKA